MFQNNLILNGKKISFTVIGRRAIYKYRGKTWDIEINPVAPFDSIKEHINNQAQ